MPSVASVISQGINEIEVEVVDVIDYSSSSSILDFSLLVISVLKTWC
jgi:hypothetical protein